ncbi:MAG: reactive intermediate/imine deaminase [Abditibacteriota bacterium]|nr:reactive intermediate/imine deaminase [Abditibacteriota bacterium]
MKEVFTDKAPAAVGPYSQGIVGGNVLYISGQLPINPQTGELITDIKAAARQALKNIIAIAETVSSKDKIVRTTVYIKNISDFSLVNEVYAEIFTDTKPSRVCVGVDALPKGAPLEIEAIAIIE